MFFVLSLWFCLDSLLLAVCGVGRQADRQVGGPAVGWAVRQAGRQKGPEPLKDEEGWAFRLLPFSVAMGGGGEICKTGTRAILLEAGDSWRWLQLLGERGPSWAYKEEEIGDWRKALGRCLCHRVWQGVVAGISTLA